MVRSLIESTRACRQTIDTLPADIKGAAICAFAGMSLKDFMRLKPEVSPFVPDPDRTVSGGTARCLSVEQLNDVYDKIKDAPPRDRALIKLALTTGMRQVELRRLTVDSVNWSKRMILVRGKGGRKRWAYLVNGSCYNSLYSITVGVDPKSPVFRNQNNGEALSRNGIRDIMSKYLPDGYGPHNLRHTFITELLRHGVSIQDAMDMAGHSSASSHAVYSHLTMGHLADQWTMFHHDATINRIGGSSWPPVFVGSNERFVVVRDSDVDAIATSVRACSGSGPSWLSRAVSGYGIGMSEYRKAMVSDMLYKGCHPFVVAVLAGVSPEWLANSPIARDSFEARRDKQVTLDNIYLSNSLITI